MDLPPSLTGAIVSGNHISRSLDAILSFWNRFTKLTVHAEDDSNKMGSVF